MLQNGSKQNFISFLYKISNLFLLNILWIVFSIPVITLGASTAALYSVTLKMAKDEETYIFRSFLHAFKDNLRQGLCLCLVYGAVGGLLYFNLYTAASGKLFAQAFFMTVFGIMAILYLLIGVYIFPVLARFETGLMKLLKISIYLSLRHIGYSVLMTVIIALPYGIVGSYLYLFPVLLIIGVSGTAYIVSYFLNRIFNKYISDETTESL